MRDAGLKLVGGRVVATGTSREGRTLKVAETKAAIISEIGARQAGAAAPPVAAVVKAVDPKLSSADAKAFAPKMKVISKYSIFYWVIVNNHWGGNIEAPATAINGTVVPAGAKFDFWKTVGDVSRLPGVGPGNAIVNGKITVTGALGGGICTTSTTLFNAAFRAGMVPLAKKNHNEYITRYPAGLDATVWKVGNAKQTMSFKNDTKYPILITRTVTQAGSKRWLTFKIWSVPNGRKAKVSNLVIQHGPRAKDTIVKDPTKPVGYRYRNNAPADGAKVWVTVTIYDHGKLHWTQAVLLELPGGRRRHSWWGPRPDAGLVSPSHDVRADPAGATGACTRSDITHLIGSASQGWGMRPSQARATGGPAVTGPGPAARRPPPPTPGAGRTSRRHPDPRRPSAPRPHGSHRATAGSPARGRRPGR